MLRTPRLAGTRADYDRVLKQRNSLLKTAGAGAAAARRDAALGTLAVWDEQLARHGAELLEARLALVDDLRPYVGKAYETVARGASRDDAEIEYKSSVPLDAARSRLRSSPSWNAGGRTSSTAASRWSARTATSCCSGSGTAPTDDRPPGCR